MGEHQRTVDKITQYGYQLRIILQLEIFPGEIIVLGFGSIAAKGVAQHILLAGEIFQIFMQPHCPVARSAYLVSLKVEELIGRHILR